MGWTLLLAAAWPGAGVVADDELGGIRSYDTMVIQGSQPPWMVLSCSNISISRHPLCKGEGDGNECTSRGILLLVQDREAP